MGDTWQDWFQGDESLVWEDAPMTGIRHWVRNALLTAFGIPFLVAGFVSLFSGLGMFASLTLVGLGAGLFLTCFSVPFIGVGAAMVFGPWYAEYYAHKFVRYALSTKRGYIATRWWKRKMEVLDIRADQPVEIVGDHTVYFHTTVGFDSDGDRTTSRKGFENIADARKVYGLIRDIQAGSLTEPAP